MTRVFTIGGFTETVDESTGMQWAYQAHIRRYDNHEDIDVEPVRPWKSKWKRIAKRAALDGVDDVVIVAYSWGAGWGAQVLAEELLRLGVRVPLVVLCDPVYRPKWLPTWMSANVFGFRALTPNLTAIKVPYGVGRVVGVRQNTKWQMLKGHKLSHRGQKFHLPLVRGAKHSDIDSSPQWFRLVSSELKRYFGL